MATVASSNVAAVAVKTQDWGTGYEAQFRLTNENSYDVLNWTLDLDWAEGPTWFSDGDLKRGEAGRATLVPKEWNRVIRAGSSMVMGFGGKTRLPEDLVFRQALPLVGVDASLRTRGTFGDKALAPYVDACAFPTPDLPAIARDTGLRFLTLAFVVADRAGAPAWGGTIPLGTQYLLDQIRQLRAEGGDVSVSFGGANGTELAQAIQDVDALVRAYERVVELYSLRRIDLDIEGGAVADAASVDRRNRALARLQKLHPELEITYCLPVLPTGLTPDGEAVLRSARKHGVRLSGIHGMSMGKLHSATNLPMLP